MGSGMSETVYTKTVDGHFPDGVGGLWTRAKRGDKVSAMISCHDCKRPTSLHQNHLIDSEGKVTASFVCGYDDCNYHEYITLEGWTG